MRCVLRQLTATEPGSCNANKSYFQDFFAKLSSGMVVVLLVNISHNGHCTSNKSEKEVCAMKWGKIIMTMTLKSTLCGGNTDWLFARYFPAGFRCFAGGGLDCG